ncbi:MAG: 2-succinyl-5-enolpyruvyl-6-hydroxy-3-cyclohexene-1-carboxylate synthase [Bacteroides sp.]|nr:2-succinyl-5-enolpyruvyl-6-hydroxy-3-cyclohexene-1-carboxylate synthase [Bacteroides sp.]
MEQYYSIERNVQIVVSLLKQHGIRKVVASPGSTNVTFVGSIQQDPYFEIYSSVDERSAAYIACGLAAESGEPVAISCTGATASRNYFPALTEAYYRKLPILAITSTQDESKIGHLIPQVIDRSCQPKDTIKHSVHLPTVKDSDDEWYCVVKANEAMLALKHHGFGPAHINLTTTYSKDFSVKDLPKVRKIERWMSWEEELFPTIPEGKVLIYTGSHTRMSNELTKAIDDFCATYNAAVVVDSTANYNGAYRVPYQIVAQQQIDKPNLNVELLIHIGEMSDFAGIVGQPKQVWRVSEDGKLIDRYRKLKVVFEMPELSFFKYYSKNSSLRKDAYYQSLMTECQRLWSEIPELPFSQLWVASQLHNQFPLNSTIHLGILSPLRSWGYFPLNPNIEVYCNQGGFGIDGNMSSMLGASLVNPNKIYFGIVGDLSFFYDMNVLGNRHMNRNVRIMLINNSLGAEFHLFKQSNLTYVNNIDKYLSAGGHFGKKSPIVVKHLAEDWGYEYLCASTKEEFNDVYKRFVRPELTDKPIIFEIFTDVENENAALYKMYNIETSLKAEMKKAIKKIASDKVINVVKEFMR